MARHAGHEAQSRVARAQLRSLLTQAERATRTGGTLGADAREALRTAAMAATPLSRGQSRRLSRVMATDALRTRQAPREELRGLTDDVMRIAEGERFARARMSGAYLDVPESLRFWRRAAFGATCVLVIGVLWSTQTSTPEGAAPGHGNSALQPLDPRNQLRLLSPLEARDTGVGGVGSTTMTPAGQNPSGGAMNGLELLMESGGNVFFFDPSGPTRLRVGFGVPRPAAPNAPEQPERN